MEPNFINAHWDELDPEIKWILGRPNFHCGTIARRMREIGYSCEFKAETEQAMVIHALLKFYLTKGENWQKEFENHLK